MPELVNVEHEVTAAQDRLKQAVVWFAVALLIVYLVARWESHRKF